MGTLDSINTQKKPKTTTVPTYVYTNGKQYIKDLMKEQYVSTIQNGLNFSIYSTDNHIHYTYCDDKLPKLNHNWQQMTINKCNDVYTNLNDEGVFWVKTKNGKFLNCYRTVNGNPNVMNVTFHAPTNVIDIQYNGKWGIILCVENLIIFDMQTAIYGFNISQNIKERRKFHKFNKQKTFKIALGRDHALFLDENGSVRSGIYWKRDTEIGSYFCNTVYKTSTMINFDDVYVFTKRQLVFIHGFIRTYFNEKYNQTSVDIINLLWKYVPVFKQYVSPNSFYEQIKIKDIKCGFHNNLALDQNGCVYFWTGHLYKERSKPPQVIKALMQYNIIEIKCGSKHMYAKSDDNKHFLWGENTYNQCLTDNGQVMVHEPFCINQVVQKETNCESIVSVNLGNDNTQIICL